MTGLQSYRTEGEKESERTSLLSYQDVGVRFFFLSTVYSGSSTKNIRLIKKKTLSIILDFMGLRKHPFRNILILQIRSMKYRHFVISPKGHT